EVTNNPVYLTAAQQWTEWYIMHLNANGTIYNYTGTPGNWISTNSYDSTDAYASTFLEVAQKVLLYSSAKSSVAQLITASIQPVLYAYGLTMQSYNLTLAMPGYDFAFLEDNAEGYRGLVAASEIQGLSLSQ